MTIIEIHLIGGRWKAVILYNTLVFSSDPRLTKQAAISQAIAGFVDLGFDFREIADCPIVLNPEATRYQERWSDK